MTNLQKKILSELNKIEKEFDVKILYACESGSRGWGFPSKNSDYDVRFIYSRTPDYYFSLFAERDVIELPIEDDLDINGWDIKKTLILFYRSNPALLEWISSPIIYLDRFGFRKNLWNLIPEYFSYTACFYYYMHMAQKNYKEFRKNKNQNIKEVFYVLRPVLACRWLTVEKKVVPMAFEELLKLSAIENKLKKEIEVLIQIKKGFSEKDSYHIPEGINVFLQDEIDRFEDVDIPQKQKRSNTQNLDKFFRETVESVWR